MPRAEAPLIDPRTYNDLVAEVEELMQAYTAGSVEPAVERLTGAVLDQEVNDPATGETFPAGTLLTPLRAQQIAAIDGLGRVRVKGWQKPVPPQEGDAGWALARIFGRMAELVVTRLNRLPDRSFLAFLDLIGTRLNPPQPARVPLTFQLAAGSPVDALVPAGTQAAALPLEEEAEPALFETERDLVVTRSQLATVYSREPGRDLWADHTPAATGSAPGGFRPFRGDRRIEHRLHVSEPLLLAMPEEKTFDLLIGPADEAHPWLSAVSWSYRDGGEEKPAAPASITFQAGPPAVWRVRFADLPGIAAGAVNGLGGPWLHGRLDPGLPRGARGEVVRVGQEQELRRRGARPAAVLTEASGAFAEVDPGAPFFPFGEELPVRTFYLCAGVDFTKPRSWIEIEAALDPELPPDPSGDLDITWEYSSGGTWKALAGAVFTPASTPPAGEPVDLFLADGRLRFQKPDDWASGTVNGVPGYWIRGRVTAGSFVFSPDYRPPRVLRLSLGDDWRLPRVESLRVAAAIDRRAAALRRLPERGFGNQAPLDLSRDFLPFGDKPWVGDAFYLASGEVLSKPGAEVELHVNLTDAATVPAPDTTTAMLTWEHWDGTAWRFLGNTGPGAAEADKEDNAAQGFSDTTNGFLLSGTVSFTLPPAAVLPGTVNGEERRWVRARLARGSYGVEARYEPVTVEGQTQYRLVPATFKPPSLAEVRLGYLYESGTTDARWVLAENDAVFADVSVPAAGAGDFTPFVPAADQRPTLYLGFERPGEAAGFANRTASLFFQVSEALYDPGVEPGAVTEEAVVVWEYWNGEAWERLGTRDETRGLTRRGLLTFIGPPDFRRSRELGREAFWLRGRWERGEYAAEPRLDRVLTNTTWAVHARTLRDEVLGSSRGEPGQVFRTLRSPVLAGQRLEVVEPEVPSGADLAELTAEEGAGAVTVVRDAQGQAEVRVRWHEVSDFYGSGPRSRHYVLDHGTGEVRFGDGRRGLVPPPGRGNIRMARYQAGGSLAGNRPAGSIAQLKGTVPYVDAVVQHVAAEGGAPEESLDAVRARGPKALRHRDRATAAADYEDLAFQASPQVARARALPVQRGGQAGQVGLIVVPSVSGTPEGGDRPVPGLELLSRVRSFIEARLSPVVDFWVVGPDWLQVDVRAEVVPLHLEGATDIQTAVLERLRAFLHPLRGGPRGEGWEFGRKPHRSDLYALIEETPGVDHVRRLEVVETPREGGARPGRFLVFSGGHEISVSGNIDDIANPGSLS